MKIAELLLQTLGKNGVSIIFGNPGTTEIPLVRACERYPSLNYIVALSEVSAVPMADGYARATRSLGVVNLHVAPGLGNGMGGLYTAAVAQTPLLVLIGAQDRRFLHTQPILWGPIERMAGAVTKAVFSLNTFHDSAFYIRRAIRAALTQPYAPVSLICPPDLLEEDIDTQPLLVNSPVLAALPAAGAQRYAEVLNNAKHPALIAAEDVFWNDASAELEQLAAILAAPIYVAPYTAVLPVSSRSPYYAGYLPPSRKQIAERLSPHDALFFVGGKGMRTTLYSEAELLQPKLWIGNDPTVLASEGEFTLATVADTRGSLTEIICAVDGSAGDRGAIKGSLRPHVAAPPYDPVVFHPSRAVCALLDRFPGAIWFDESGLSTSDVRQWMQLPSGEYLINGSGGIGWGLAASVGAALGNPGRQVVAIIGDGSALYASEAMWTAAHHSTKLLLVILSNRRYSTLNEAAERLGGEALDSFTIEPPTLNFGGLAALYGWRYFKAACEGELGAFLKSLSEGVKTNTLLELELDPSVRPVTANHHF
jgi:benzoylformate decarboxylase